VDLRYCKMPHGEHSTDASDANDNIDGYPTGSLHPDSITLDRNITYRHARRALSSEGDRFISF
jgi:hypothetical protein